ncbi:anti-sigma factor [Alkalitalea saponilacus]|uniref:Zinc-finger n=1 Tax=Alkalitalea saponilacus TaxID=889453 RepID=A0A1T5HSS9_9BACT|nr:hypothetical protein [Alkalitalea saponilacus]ASB49250.1 hypothetical protein CDL62_08915 [Alkalitalea saponilacus]SKC23736.1 hypothetical protein SAMN03080601_03021 [Alkalitalea saponilacus]
MTTDRNNKQINRENYFEWFLEFTDGNLSEEEKDALKRFLLENPDLTEEFQELTSGADLCLSIPHEDTFPNKSRIKKAPEPFSSISEYDYLLIKNSEEELTISEQSQLISILEKDPDSERELKLYERLKLQVPEVVMPGRSKLLQRSVGVNYFNYLKVAAAAILIFMMFNYRENISLNDSSQELRLAQVAEFKPIIHEPVMEEEIFSIQSSDVLVTSPTFFADEVIGYTAKPQVSDVLDEPELLQLPRPAIQPLDPGIMPNAYEAGLALMLPQYVENRRLMAQLDPERSGSQNEDTKTLLERTGVLFRSVNPLSNLAYNRVYDEEGEVVAINISSDNFELTQKVPKWLAPR